MDVYVNIKKAFALHFYIYPLVSVSPTVSLTAIKLLRKNGSSKSSTE